MFKNELLFNIYGTDDDEHFGFCFFEGAAKA